MIRSVVLALAAGACLFGGVQAVAQMSESPASPTFQIATYTIPAAPLAAEDDTVSDSGTSAAPPPQSLTGLVDAIVALPSIELSDDLKCLATAVYFESKGEPVDGQLAVAQVILNRVESGRYAANSCGVIHQAGQFSFARDGRSDHVGDSRQWRIAQAVAVIAATRNWKEIVGNATAFHATRVAPKWAMTRVSRIGNHVFYAAR